MKCPVCEKSTTEFDAGSIRIDVCADGCSGIWLDRSEFDKIDNASEPFPEDLLRVRKAPNVLIDRSLIRNCPRCSVGTKTMPMDRVAVNPDTRFELDRCGSCEGIWLDLGELEHIRALDKDNTARKAKLEEYERSAIQSILDLKLRRGINEILSRFLQ